MNEDFHKRLRRLEQLIHAVESAEDKIPRVDALEIVRSLLELHGAGLERVVGMVAQANETGAGLLRRLASDDLVSGLLLLYDLHPDDDETRIRRALDKVRPYLRSHGGDVELIGITSEGAVRLRLDGSCKSCPSSAMTLKLAVENAVYEAAPNITAIVADGLAAHAVVKELPQRGPTDASASGDGIWENVPDLAALLDGRVHAIEMSGRSILFCRIGDSYYAYGNRCPGCQHRLEGGRLESERLVCSSCMRQYDLVLAGRSSDGADLQLVPFPLLVSEGHARVALPELSSMSPNEGGM